jgi:chitin deacetylase
MWIIVASGMLRRALLAIAVAISALMLFAWGTLQLMNSRRVQLVGDLVTRVETMDSAIALTFDDGPVPVYTDSVLGILDELEVRATFFMVGSAIERHPEIAAEVRARGHELGNHSYTHARLVFKAPSRIRHEVDATDALIRAAGQTGEIFFRPPNGKRLIVLPWYLARQNRPVVLWDLEPDTYHNNADDVVEYVLNRVRPGSILLLHVEIPSRVQNRLALPRIIRGLRARGYRFVTLSELMRRES